jgi:FkbM family methyltransferase
MKVLLDVGAHFGQTTEIALNPIWGFDEIHAFEPSSNSFKKLSQIKSKRLKCHQFGLYSKDANLPLIGSGEVGASIYDKKIHSIESQKVEAINLISVTKWLSENIDFSKTEVYLKLNCEGSEADILQSLIDSEMINNFASMYIDFDIRKIPGHEHKRFQIEEDLRRLAIKFSTWEDLYGSLTEGEKQIPYYTFTKWLGNDCTHKPVTRKSMIHYELKLHLSTLRILRSLIAKYAPQFVIDAYRRLKR